MLTLIIKRTDEPKVIQMTQEDIVRQVSSIQGAEILLEDTWLEGLRKVRTPLVCLVEADCVFSSSYMASNYGLINKHVDKGGKGGGYNKLAMISSCIGVKTFDNRIYNYKLEKVKDSNLRYTAIQPHREKRDMKLYNVQVGFVPGSIIRMASLGRDIDSLPWDDPNLVKMSTAVSFHFWGSGRRIELNPNTTYVSGNMQLEDPPHFKLNIPDLAANLFLREGI